MIPLFLLILAIGAADEQSIVRVPREDIPPAPALPAEEALKTFTLKDGFRMELIASEPMVEEPVALSFDERGRIWVVEMRGFMPNPDGTGEQDIPGRVSILEDTNRDGLPDKKTVFLDNLIMPRAVACVRGGALIAEPPHLWFCRDTNGDDVSDEKTEIASDYGDPKNPEHCANGLLLARDNWIYSLYHGYRYRFTNGIWTRETNPVRAQWGLTQDDYGRLIYTSNSDHLRGDLLPTHYLADKPAGSKMPGLGHKIAADQTVWPGRVNPGVNRGYLPNTLKADGRLDKFTAACGTVIYRGDLFPRDFYGNAFVCEPAANMIRRSIISEKDGIISAENAYEKSEFLTSTDERFRPVNLYNGPDGALYVVDMYHGILQHRMYLTAYLRRQAEDRGLQEPIHLGRIYRIVPRTRSGKLPPNLAAASTRELVQSLMHHNGWIRDTAQRLMVERQDTNAIPLLKNIKPDLARLHAFWTLEGLGHFDRTYLKDGNPYIRAAAFRISGRGDPSDGDALAQSQFALFSKDREALRKIVEKSPFALARDAAKFSLGEYEIVARKTKPATPLTAEERILFNGGKTVYEMACVPCHQPHGMGQEGLAPPLAQSEWVAGPPQRLVRIILNGLRGPIKVKGQTYELDMPSLAVLSDEQIAAVLTYVRREWNHGFSAVTPTMVKQVREATAKREDAWTSADLLKVK